MQKILRYATIYHAQVKLAISGSGPKGAGLSDSFWIKFVQMCQRLHANPYNIAAVVQHESGFDPGARNVQNGVIVAQGLNQLIHSTAMGLGIAEDLWKNFYKLPPEESLKWTEKFFQQNSVSGKSAGDIYVTNFGGFNNPDGSMYAGLAAQEAYKRDHPGAVFKNPQYQQKAIEQNKGFVRDDRIMPETVKASVRSGPSPDIKAKIDAAVAAVGSTPPPGFEEPNPHWNGPTEPDTTPTTPTTTTTPAPKLPGTTNQPAQPKAAPIPTPAQQPDEEATLENMLWS